VVKVHTEVPPRASREVERPSRNHENDLGNAGGNQRDGTSYPRWR